MEAEKDIFIDENSFQTEKVSDTKINSPRFNRRRKWKT